MRLDEFGYSADDLDQKLVEAGFITEEERISRGYQRIHAEQMKRRLFTSRRTHGVSHDNK